jgi:hypothetical protein
LGGIEGFSIITVSKIARFDEWVYAQRAGDAAGCPGLHSFTVWVCFRLFALHTMLKTRKIRYKKWLSPNKYGRNQLLKQ